MQGLLLLATYPLLLALHYSPPGPSRSATSTRTRSSTSRCSSVQPSPSEGTSAPGLSSSLAEPAGILGRSSGPTLATLALGEVSPPECILSLNVQARSLAALDDRSRLEMLTALDRVFTLSEWEHWKDCLGEVTCSNGGMARGATSAQARCNWGSVLCRRFCHLLTSGD